ncbi:MAG: serine/threonine-protein kinase [Solirubrobacteraceae bacterium]
MTATGQRFAGYELEEFIGDGGNGAIYRARDLRLQRPVALRIVAPDIARDAAARERLNRASTAVALVDHPNVAPIYETGEVDSQIFIASRWIDGVSLKSLVREQGALDPRRAVRIVNQVASALQAAHGLGIIHRNVKPSSVLVTPVDHAYLTEFGLARRQSDLTGLTVANQLLDTFDYVAPEYIEGLDVDYRADIYGLGCLLYEALTGEVPYPRAQPAAKLYAHVSSEPPSARAVRPEVSDQLDAVVRRAMAKRPEDRQQSAGEFAVDAAGGLSMSAPPWAIAAAPGVVIPPPSHPAPAPAPPAPPSGPGGPAPRGTAPAPVASGASAPDGDARRDGKAAHLLLADPAKASDGDDRAVQLRREPARDGYYDAVFYTRPRRSVGRVAIWAIAVLIFLAAPIALLIALIS